MEKPAGYYSSLDSLYDSTDNGSAVMSDKDKHIYNLLQRTTIEKVRRAYFIVWQVSTRKCLFLQQTYSSLGLHQAEKTAVLKKTGPCPKWCTPWRTRNFALKGNFLYYYKPNTKVSRYT